MLSQIGLRWSMETTQAIRVCHTTAVCTFLHSHSLSKAAFEVSSISCSLWRLPTSLTQTHSFFKPHRNWASLPCWSHMGGLWILSVNLVWQKVIPTCLWDWVWEDLGVLANTLKSQQRSQIWDLDFGTRVLKHLQIYVEVQLPRWQNWDAQKKKIIKVCMHINPTINNTINLWYLWVITNFSNHQLWLKHH